jgi:type II secretory pathway component PulK
MKRRRKSDLSQPRSGIVLGAVLIGLMIASTMLLAMTKQAFLSRERLRQHIRRHQATQLSEAGLSRALHAIENDEHYRGEVWRVTDLPSETTGEVAIEINATNHQLTILTRYPTNRPGTIRQTRVVSIPRSQP